MIGNFLLEVNFVSVKFEKFSHFFQNFHRSLINFGPTVDSTSLGDAVQRSDDQSSAGLHFMADFIKVTLLES